uniref:Uncharacterized protein n=1 Tax=Pseudoalteromonas luteoviolacea TaxID=43657 RepID=A0A023Q1B8_9GAMM|nr:hypothetical protein [Pseudoalteromonas luteoviolacea]
MQVIEYKSAKEAIKDRGECCEPFSKKERPIGLSGFND